MRPSRLVALAAALATAGCDRPAPHGDAAEPTHGVETGYPILVERDVATAMRDGTKLFADVYRPKATGRFPVLVMRTPYDRHANPALPVEAATRGYIVVVQDVRGRYRSEGAFYPFAHEADDGYDTVEWAAKLRGSDGRVGMFGVSYGGATVLLAAAARPPHLAAILPAVTASSYYEGWTHRGGALEQWFDESWAASLAIDSMHRELRARSPLDGVEALPIGAYPLYDAGSPHAFAPYFDDWLAHPTYDDYWRATSIEERYDAIRLPALHDGDWYDIFLAGTLRNFIALKSHGGQRLRIGPGNHVGSAGEVDFGPSAAAPLDPIGWFDVALKGKADAEKPVQIFVMGKNVWRAEDDWPLARARATRYRLHAGGRLDPAVAGKEAPDSFVYDPADPVPTRGGALCCDPHLPAGPMDQRSVEARKDVLVYTSAPFEREVEITGPVSIDLFVGSSARDTDFTAKLVDVWPSGLAQNLSDGIVRMRYRDRRSAPAFLEPGAIYPITIDLAATSDVLLAGHRLRVEVSSSNFPRFDRNLNVEESPEQARTWVKATNTVFHDSDHDSALVVPVVE